MTKGPATALVLAAGRGKRLRSSLPKVMHRVAGRPLLVHVLAALEELKLARTVVVVPPDFEPIQEAVAAEGLNSAVEYVVQDPPAGTGDAVKVALEKLGDVSGPLLVVAGDSPLIRSETLASMLDMFAEGAAATVVLTARLADASGYGRIVRGEGGVVDRIVEDADASAQERAIDEINGCVYVFDADRLAELIPKLDKENQQSEYYLTDIVTLLRSQGEEVLGVEGDASEVPGANTRAQLAEVRRLLHQRSCERWLDEGVTIMDPATTYIDVTVELSPDCVIQPFTFLEGATRVGERAEIGPQARLVDADVGADAVISFAVVRDSVIGPEASVGPFASIRPGTRLGRGARIGTFVETKQTEIGEGSKANHLAYLGDAEIGKGVNIGAGSITCNWDGQEKHKTVIEDDAYISSDTMLVAPTHIGKRAATGAGAVVKGDVPDDALAVGVPARIIEGKGDKFGRKTKQDSKNPRE